MRQTVGDAANEAEPRAGDAQAEAQWRCALGEAQHLLEATMKARREHRVPALPIRCKSVKGYNVLMCRERRAHLEKVERVIHQLGVGVQSHDLLVQHASHERLSRSKSLTLVGFTLPNSRENATQQASSEFPIDPDVRPAVDHLLHGFLALLPLLCALTTLLVFILLSSLLG